jgi:hypothetical protein
MNGPANFTVAFNQFNPQNLTKELYSPPIEEAPTLCSIVGSCEP